MPKASRRKAFTLQMLMGYDAHGQSTTPIGILPYMGVLPHPISYTQTPSICYKIVNWGYSIAEGKKLICLRKKNLCSYNTAMLACWQEW